MFATPIRKIAGAATILLLLAFVSIAISWWWQTRPLQVTTLSVAEKQKVDRQLQPLLEEIDADRVISSHSIQLTEHELNGYISQNQQLAGKVYFTLKDGYLSAKVVTNLPKQSPILAGKKIRLTADVYFERHLNGLEVKVMNINCFGFNAPQSIKDKYADTNLLPLLFDRLGITDNYSQVTNITVTSTYITLSTNN